MITIVILCVCAVIMTEIYARTKKPKLYAFINSVMGVGGFLLWQYFLLTDFNVTPYNSAFSAILGLPGAALLYILKIGG